jgi:predicted patatin/cPLA2 family phospholipase
MRGGATIGREPGRGLARRVLAVVTALAASLVLASCSTLDRLPPVPLSLASDIVPLSIPFARFYADGDQAQVEAFARELAEKALRAETVHPTPASKPNNYLAMSGGGDDGAFGAGLLLGWTARGDRPSFRIVTGTSTGALSAPFAFLGPDYDDELKAVYTETSAKDIFSAKPVLAAVAGDSLADTRPLRNLISRYLDKKMIARIAEEYDKGRFLLISTTNLDQSRSVIWNIGAIAKSPDPRARDLIIEVLRASASIPGAFPPVMLDVTVDGKRYEEMHVDGGTVAQSFLYPPQIHLKKEQARYDFVRKNVAYIIRNGRLFRPEEQVKRNSLAIAGKAISTMTAAGGVNDTYRIYLTTRRDGVDFNLAFIGEDFTTPYKGPFDRTYMNTLFQYGFEKGKAGYAWAKVPPGYSE